MFGNCHPQSLEEAGNHTKKKTKRYREQDPAQVNAYLGAVSEIPEEKLLYIDEMGIDSYLYREYCRAPRGKVVYGLVSGKKYKRTGIVAAQRGKEILAPLQYDGTMNSSLFETWLETRLLPTLPPQSVIVMDNASFHKKSRLIPIVEKQGHRLIFLPPYSPDLNPIENFWAWLKRRLRKVLPHFPSFDDALSDCFQVR